MELRGGAIVGNSQEVIQRIYGAGGSVEDNLAGTFTYHPQHGHIHFDGFAEYRLREVLPNGDVGAILSTGEKISFCLLDVERYNTSGPASPFYLTCGQVQGISPGWADVYDRGLDGQSIDITNIPNGNYFIEVVVDPDNHLIEANESNNVERIQIALQRGGSTTADAFEPNDSFAAASILAPPEDHTYPDLSIHAAGNNDYYRVTASATGTLTVRLAFQHSQGDIDLEVFNASQTRLGISESVLNAEQLSVSATAGQFFYVRVFGYNGAINPNYTLTIDQPAGGGTPSGDIFENNDTFATARSLPASDQTYSSLSIDAANDADYYSLVPTVSGTLTVSLAFLNSQGDIDLEVYNAAQTRLSISESTGNAELLSVLITAGQTYFIRVFGYNGVTNPNYSMSIGVGVSPSSAEYYLSTTANGSLSSTNGSPTLAFTDTDILKLTVLANGQYGYQLHFDGSDVGLTTTNEDIDAFEFLYDGSILISTVGAFSVPAPSGPALVGNGEDLLRFVPSSIGATTAGQWSIYFDGSDVGLSGAAENIDAVQSLANGRLLISTTGNVAVTGASGTDEDLLSFIPTTLGATTAGTWSLYFDGSDVGLANNDNEDIRALYLRETSGNPTLFFTTVGGFSVTGASGTNEDIFAFNPTSLGATTAGTFGPGLAFDGSLYGLSSFAVDGIHLGALPTAGQAAVLSSETATSAELSLATTTTAYRPRPSGNLAAGPQT